MAAAQEIIELAREKGELTRAAGLARDRNPYRAQTLRWAWNAGYDNYEPPIEQLPDWPFMKGDTR